VNIKREGKIGGSVYILSVIVVLLGLVSSGCVQEYALEPVALVKGKRIEVSPAGLNKIQIRVNMVGTCSNNVPGTSDYALVDVEGDFTLRTRRLGRGWVVARGVDYDIGFDNVYLDEFGVTDSLDRLIPATDSVTLYQKTAGEALFLVFEQDFGDFQSVHLVGDFNDFKMDENARALHDDGSLVDLEPFVSGMQVSGDYEAGDGVWTLRTKLDSGEQKYAFIFDQEGDYKVDPYQEKGSGDPYDYSKSIIVIK
jgi:hypothetical protein